MRRRACFVARRGTAETCLSRRLRPNRGAHRGRAVENDARRKDSHDPRPVEILVARRAASGHPRVVVHRRPARHTSRGAVGRVGAGRLDQRLVHGLSRAHGPGRDLEPRHGGALRPLDRCRGALPREGRAARSRRQHIPHASRRPQLRVYGRGPLPCRRDGRALHPRGTEAGRGRLRQALCAQQRGDAPPHGRHRSRRPRALRDIPARIPQGRRRGRRMEHHGLVQPLPRRARLP